MRQATELVRERRPDLAVDLLEREQDRVLLVAQHPRHVGGQPVELREVDDLLLPVHFLQVGGVYPKRGHRISSSSIATRNPIAKQVRPKQASR